MSEPRSPESYEREINSLSQSLHNECSNSLRLANENEVLRAASGMAMLAEFHAAVAHPDTDLLVLRDRLHREEHEELVDALASGDMLQVARELADVVYVAYGTAHAFRIDLDVALAEVHRANMQKAHEPRRADGKAMKPLDFVPPDMTAAVAEMEDGEIGAGEDSRSSLPVAPDGSEASNQRSRDAE